MVRITAGPEGERGTRDDLLHVVQVHAAIEQVGDACAEREADEWLAGAVGEAVHRLVVLRRELHRILKLVIFADVDILLVCGE
jgi:hypothetical protein